MKAIQFPTQFISTIALFIFFFSSSGITKGQCNCDYMILSTTGANGIITFDATGVQPGETICIGDSIYSLHIVHLGGDYSNPIVLQSCNQNWLDTLEIRGDNYWLKGDNQIQISNFYATRKSPYFTGSYPIKTKHFNTGVKFIGGFLDSVKDGVYESCTFDHIREIYGQWVAYIPQDSTVFDNCTFQNNSWIGTTGGVTFTLNECSVQNTWFEGTHGRVDSLFIMNSSFVWNDYYDARGSNYWTAFDLTGLYINVSGNSFKAQGSLIDLAFRNNFGLYNPAPNNSSHNYFRRFQNNVFENMPIVVFVNGSPYPMKSEFIHNSFINTSSHNRSSLYVFLREKLDANHNLISGDNFEDTVRIINNTFYTPYSTTLTGTNKYNPYFRISNFQNYITSIITHYKNCQFEEQGNVYLNNTNGFVDPANGDYRLNTTSPAINAGVFNHSVPSQDYFENPRVMDNRPDAGYHEWHPDPSFTNSNQVELQGIYCKKFEDIMIESYNNNNQNLNIPEARAYLERLQQLGFNYLIVYGLNNLYWQYGFGQSATPSAIDNIVADFIRLAKEEYGIVQIAGTGEKASSFDKIVTYNDQGRDYFTRIDVLHFEYEFWNTKNWNGYSNDFYSSNTPFFSDLANPGNQSTWLPNTAEGQSLQSTDSYEHSLHFSYMINELKKSKALALDHKLLLEFYASRTEIEAYDSYILSNNPSLPSEELQYIAQFAQRICLAHYNQTDPDAGDGLFTKPTTFGYSPNYVFAGAPYGGPERYEKLGSNGVGSIVMPIFHGRENFSGFYLANQEHALSDFYESFKQGTPNNSCGFETATSCNQNGQFISNNTLAGSIWYKDEYLLDHLNCLMPSISLNSEQTLVVREGMSTHIDFSIEGDLPVDINVYQNGNPLPALSVNNWTNNYFQIYIPNFSSSDNGSYEIQVQPSSNNSCYNSSYVSSATFNRQYSSLKTGYFDGATNQESNENSPADTEKEHLLTENLEISIYPNPTSGIIQIKNYKELQNIKIIDQSGRVFLQQAACPSSLDISSTLNAGVYFFIGETKKGILRQSIIVQ